MDVSSPVEKRLPIYREICCDVCGYPRTGLPNGSLCPECGGEPPKSIRPIATLIGAAQDRSEQAWLAQVGAGLILLLITSIQAITVELMMPIGGLGLVAVNAPGPKLFASALLYRSVGSPGEYGVGGTLAVLGNVLAIWFITQPRWRTAGREQLVSRRILARWAAVIGCGALFGFLLSGYQISRYWGWDALPPLTISVAIAEMGTNTLLYAYFVQLAERFEPRPDRPGHVVRLLRPCVWLIPVVCLSGAGISLLRGQMQDQPVQVWRLVHSVYGSLSLVTGMLMTAGALHLTARMCWGVLDITVIRLLRQLPGIGRTIARGVRAVRSTPDKWIALAGLAFLLWSATPSFQVISVLTHRNGLGGDLPTINFVGPKITAATLLMQVDWGYYTLPWDRLSGFYSVIAVWMITCLRPAPISLWRRDSARWIPTVLMGAAIGIAITIAEARVSVRQSYWVACMVIAVEAPATFLLYRYLASLAAALGHAPLSLQLRRFSAVVAILIVAPLGFHVLSASTRPYHNSPFVLSLGAICGAVTIGSGLYAWAAIGRLAWALLSVRQTHKRRPQPIIATT
jgi:hypothetical protein